MRVLIFDADMDDYMGAASQTARKLAATKQPYTETDRRTAPAEDIPAYRDNPERLQREWYGMGANHRTVNGHAERDIAREGWFIVVYSLSDLLTLLMQVPAVKLADSPETMFKVDW